MSNRLKQTKEMEDSKQKATPKAFVSGQKELTIATRMRDVLLERNSTNPHDWMIISRVHEFVIIGVVRVSANLIQQGYFYPVPRSNAPVLFLVTES